MSKNVSAVCIFKFSSNGELFCPLLGLFILVVAEVNGMSRVQILMLPLYGCSK